uniref:DUF4220 domain-containing protein n=1 Tax=Heterorhabditis bacteriophora TaxID=37862 RepID=A0A1I7X6K6_HETBA
MWSSDEERNAQVDKKMDIADARIGLYGILLARVHDSWARGAVSGSTAHVIIALLEHGIDEGNIFVEDIEEHLKIIEPNIFSRVLFRMSETIFKWICHRTFINEFAEMGDYKLFPKEASRRTKHIIPRSLEKWWIFHTFCICTYSVALAYYILDGGGDVNRAVVYIICAVIWLMNVMETLYIFHKEKSTWKQKTVVESMNVCEMNDRRKPSIIHRVFWKEFWPTKYYIWITLISIFCCQLVEGLIRLELKENVAEIEVVPVIKTRQAIRMMSFQLSNTLGGLKTEGFMPEDAKDRWEEVVDDLRARAENILWVPQLTYSYIFLNFVVTEWVVGQVNRHHERYAGQGEFIGERNILKLKWTGSKLPLMWPKRRYETTTYCEMVWIDEMTIEKLIEIEPNIYTIVNNEVQAERIMTELRYLNRSSDITSGTFWSGFQKYGKTLGKPEQLIVPDGKIAIVGCWTQINLIAPRSSMNKDLYIRGPSTLWVEPADDRAAGFVYFEKLSNEDTLTTVETSNVSLIHDEDNKVFYLLDITKVVHLILAQDELLILT